MINAGKHCNISWVLSLQKSRTFDTKNIQYIQHQKFHGEPATMASGQRLRNSSLIERPCAEDERG